MAPALETPAGRNETAIAIIAALVVSIVVSAILAGNPFTATRLAYTDYSKPKLAKTAPAAPEPKG